jgi:hypothetical protein
MKDKDISTTLGAFVIILVAILFGFLLLQEGEALKDTYEYGSDSIQKLNELEQALKEAREEPEP